MAPADLGPHVGKNVKLKLDSPVRYIVIPPSTYDIVAGWSHVNHMKFPNGGLTKKPQNFDAWFQCT